MSRSRVVKAPAKLNLGLRIGDRRSDGFHRIETVFQTVSLFDTLEVTFSSEFSEDRLDVTGPVSVPENGDNLILRLLQSLRSKEPELPYARVELEKVIPTGSGLGGGSSDAAAVLHAAIDRFEWMEDPESYVDWAAGVGADVPFFLVGGTVLGGGIGEELTPLNSNEGAAVIAVPSVDVDTEWAYQHYGSALPNDQSHNNISSSIMNDDEKSGWQRFDLRNDFQPLILERYGVCRRILDRLNNFSTSCALSGSGSALYALFENQREAEACRSGLVADFPDVSWFVANFVSSEAFPMIA